MSLAVATILRKNKQKASDWKSGTNQQMSYNNMKYHTPYLHIISQSLKPIACAFSNFLGIILDAICLVFYSSPSESDGHYYFVDAQTLEANYISNLSITCASPLHSKELPKNWSNLWIHFTQKANPSTELAKSPGLVQ